MYDFGTGVRVEDFAVFALQWFQELGVKPAGISAAEIQVAATPPLGPRESFDAIGIFPPDKSGLERLRAVAHGVAHLEVRSERVVTDDADWLMYACLDISSEHDQSLVSYWPDSELTSNQSYLAQLARRILAFATPAYGIFHRRPWPMPFWYALGIGTAPRRRGTSGNEYTGDALQRGQIVARWMHDRLPDGPNRSKMGFLRDVYPFNFLTAKHLGQVVDGEFLRQWIDRDPNCRGTLTQLSEQMWMWHVPDAIRNSVRATLTGTGLLICRQPGDPEGDV